MIYNLFQIIIYSFDTLFINDMSFLYDNEYLSDDEEIVEQVNKNERCTKTRPKKFPQLQEINRSQRSFLKLKFMRLGYCKNVCTYCLQLLKTDHIYR
jgi:hypothetical protein